MDYDEFFADKVAALKTEGRYRVFADLERYAGDARESYWNGRKRDQAFRPIFRDLLGILTIIP